MAVLMALYSHPIVYGMAERVTTDLTKTALTMAYSSVGSEERCSIIRIAATNTWPSSTDISSSRFHRSSTLHFLYSHSLMQPTCPFL